MNMKTDNFFKILPSKDVIKNPIIDYHHHFTCTDTYREDIYPEQRLILRTKSFSFKKTHYNIPTFIALSCPGGNGPGLLGLWEPLPWTDRQTCKGSSNSQGRSSTLWRVRMSLWPLTRPKPFLIPRSTAWQSSRGKLRTSPV